MFPNILMFHPEAARAILEYRVRTLAGALKNAQNLGYQVMNGDWVPLHQPLPQGLPTAIQWPREPHTSSFLFSIKDCPSPDQDLTIWSSFLSGSQVCLGECKHWPRGLP